MDSHYQRLLERCYGERRWIVVHDVLAGARSEVLALRDAGADDVIVVAGSRGTGPVPDVASLILGTGGATIMDAIRAFEHAVAYLPAEVAAAVERFDPKRTARAITMPFSAHMTVAGRPVHGARPVRWQALEDKTTIGALWHDAGVATSPARVVAARRAELRAAAAALDRGRGTVWVADNRAGWHGAATALRWVRTAEHAAEAEVFLAQRAHRVRVMPFLDGIPCSIHGVAFADATIAFRPCEMLVLRRPGRADLFYAGMASTWDPPAPSREDLREVARRVGDHLRRSVGYRGVFTVDGVMTHDGFRPTELNPRFGAAASLLADAADIPLYLLHLAVVERPDADWRPAHLERVIVDAADRSRGVRSFSTVPQPLPDQVVMLGWDGGRLREVGEQPADVMLVTGASPLGGGIRITPDVARHTPGRSIAGVVAAALTYADQRWDLGIGPLEAAVDLTVA